jgi:general stress protein 26
MEQCMSEAVRERVTRIEAFSEIRDAFLERVNQHVYCNLATVDPQGRPRSRVIHVIWEESTGWITTFPTLPKARHLAANPYVSLGYVADVTAPVYAECRAEWVADLVEKQRVWHMIASLAPPLGFDPTPIYGAPDDPRFGVLKLTPWRIQVTDPPAYHRIWQPK